MSDPNLLLTDLALVALANTLTTPPSNCTCSIRTCTAWESLSEDRWPAANMQKLGTLRDPEVYEPTTEEHHPNGTRYTSPDAPVSAKHFPYNRCDVYRCTPCQRVLMRYTEFGGYYVDHRVRELRSQLVAS